MENAIKEQLPVCPSGQDTQGDKAEGNSYGKFKTKEGLVDAYNSLEAEFTRRSQRIRELEGQLNNRTAEEKWNNKVGELTAKYPVAKELTAEIAEYIGAKKELLEDENCLEKALLAVLSQRYTSPKESGAKKPAENTARAPAANASVGERALSYLCDVSMPEILPQGGELPAAPRVRPKSVREAGDMARKLLVNEN